MKTHYFEIAFNYTENDIRQAEKEYYSAGIDGGYFEVPPSKIIIKIECGTNENAFDKLAAKMADTLIGARYYLEFAGKPVTITDITEQQQRKIEEDKAREQEFEETAKLFGLF